MINYLSRQFLLIILVFSLACQDASQKKNVSADSLISINIRGDTSSFSEWSPEDQVWGLGKAYIGDLDSMIARRVIRALVPYSKTFYYLDGKERRGLSYDQLELFEKELNKQLNFDPPKVRIIFIPVNRKDIIPLLREGYADLFVGGYAITPERAQQVDFSIPNITGLKAIVVGGPSAPALKSLADLSGQRVFVPENSIVLTSLKKLSDSLQQTGLKPIQIEFSDPFLEFEDILEMVNAGMISFTISVLDIAELWEGVLDSLKVYRDLPIMENLATGWAFRKSSPKLKSVLNQFVSQNRKGSLMGNIFYDTYLKDQERLRNVYSPKAMAELKDKVEIIKKYAGLYNLDWLLLAAQGYQESQLEQQTMSAAGAVGIMQVLPSTAATDPINIPDVKNVDNNIHAGAKYMRYLIDHYFNDQPMDKLNKELFALASYNAGPAMVARLRKEAITKELNANQWFDNVDKLAALHIGSETVQYVSNIYKYYTAYRAIMQYRITKDSNAVVLQGLPYWRRSPDLSPGVTWSSTSAGLPIHTLIAAQRTNLTSVRRNHCRHDYPKPVSKNIYTSAMK